VLPHTDKVGGLILAERIRRQVEQLEVESVTRLTISAGVAVLGTDGNAPTAIANADRSLYEAKARGRNRVV
jgi:diguanylate cyclase (GGDEF)-like protein